MASPAKSGGMAKRACESGKEKARRRGRRKSGAQSGLNGMKARGGDN